MSLKKLAIGLPDIEHPAGSEWADGTPSSVMHELVDYWKTSYDWRKVCGYRLSDSCIYQSTKVEHKINSTFNMFTIEIEEGGETISLHFVHHISTQEGAIPLLFAHGWPGNFLEVYFTHGHLSSLGLYVLRRSNTSSS